MDRWRWIIGALVAVHLVAGIRVMVTTEWDRPSFTTGDHLQYRDLVAAGGWPYRDKTVAFPPVSYVAFEVIEGRGSAATGGRLLVAAQLACDLVVAAALAAGWGRRAATAWLLLLLPLLWDGWVFARIDLLSVALALGGLALVRRREATAGGIALAASALAKVWSVALLPGLIVERQHRAARATVVTLAVAGAVWLAVGGVGGVLDVVLFGGSRGWQVESTVGAAAYLVTGGPLRVEGGAWRIGTEPAGIGALLGLATLTGTAVAWWLAARRPNPLAADRARLAAVGAVLVLAPVLSPQYLVWLLPFVAVLAADTLVVVLAAGATVLTAAVAHAYDDFVAGSAWWQWAAVIRNALLVAVVVVAFARLAGRPPRDLSDGPTAPTSRRADPAPA
jgi:hypothetical protein